MLSNELRSSAEEESVGAFSEAALDVEPQQVVRGKTQAADGRLIPDTGVRSMPVVAMQPRDQRVLAVA